jgi:hypothetical protein
MVSSSGPGDTAGASVRELDLSRASATQFAVGVLEDHRFNQCGYVVRCSFGVKDDDNVPVSGHMN